MAFAKLQQGTDNKQLGTGGMTGGATPGQSGGNASGAGGPTAFTNIQDYMSANKNDTTNQNYLNTAADKQMSSAKEQMGSNVASLNTINTGNQFTDQGFQDILNKNDYSTAKTNASNATSQQFKDTGNELPTIDDPTKGLNNNLSSVIDYIGGIKPLSQSYTPGMEKFDEMLLGQDKAFPGQFADSKKSAFQNEVVNPYSNTIAERDTQKKTAKENETAWQNKMKEFLAAQNTNKESDIINANKYPGSWKAPTEFGGAAKWIPNPDRPEGTFVGEEDYRGIGQAIPEYFNSLPSNFTEVAPMPEAPQYVNPTTKPNEEMRKLYEMNQPPSSNTGHKMYHQQQPNTGNSVYDFIKDMIDKANRNKRPEPDFKVSI